MLFSELIPAISFTATVNLPIILGNIATGSTLTYADLVDGNFTTESGFYPSVSGKAIRGGDWITIDPSGGILRLHLDTLIQTNDDPPEYIRIQATGAEDATKDVMDVVTGALGAKTIKFGEFQATSSWTFTTGSKQYQDLQNTVFVGSTSLKPGSKNGTFVVGFKIAKVFSIRSDISV
ncbi:hypothetical protein GQ44DRAFT_775509 [Phaeosphaeriaceae sp. PMI808]|nr:hypothetical protein GQ44DRAFT_775509 [Phaeosphaeriaceae sp. PMI808]